MNETTKALQAAGAAARTCGQIPRGKCCGQDAVATLWIGTPPALLGACGDHLAALVLEYVDSRGSVTVRGVTW